MIDKSIALLAALQLLKQFLLSLIDRTFSGSTDIAILALNSTIHHLILLPRICKLNLSVIGIPHGSEVL